MRKLLSHFSPSRHWHGRAPLAVSLFGGGFATSLGLSFLLQETLDLLAWNYRPVAGAITLVWIWVVVAAVMVWQLVGIWRAARIHHAERRADGRSTWFAWAARIAVVFGCLQGVGTFAFVARSQIDTAVTLARAPAPYEIRLEAGGRTLVFSGEIEFGAVRAIRDHLETVPQITEVRLESEGGRVVEAERMEHLVRSAGLDTRVDTWCHSACTIAFLGGRQRHLGSEALLGFHGASLAGEDEGLAAERENARIRRRLEAAGVDTTFLKRAWTAQPGLWFPSHHLLVASGVATARR